MGKWTCVENYQTPMNVVPVVRQKRVQRQPRVKRSARHKSAVSRFHRRLFAACLMIFSITLLYLNDNTQTKFTYFDKDIAAQNLGSATIVSAMYSLSFGLCHSGVEQNCVVDGDTFWMNGNKIRIADIDTPETHPARCPDEEDLGDAATLRLQSLLNA